MSAEPPPRVSVVVPTYNRGPALGDTVEALLASRLDGVGGAELLVVDDGSAEPVTLAGLPAPGAFPLTVLRQANAGPAAARNAGFQAARGEIVLFVDDDVVVPPGLLAAHVAAHRRLGPAVVFGRCVLEPHPREERLYRFLESLGQDPGRDAEEEFLRVDVVASGQLSVPRSAFPPEEGVYRRDLRTPAAEEFELALRLRARQVPIFLATRIVAVHRQPIDIRSISRQQFKHGMGYGEVAAKYPEALGLPALAVVIEATRPGSWGDGMGKEVRRALRVFAAAGVVRGGLLRLAGLVEAVPVPRRLQAALFRAAIGSHFMAGVRQGLRAFAGPHPPT